MMLRIGEHAAHEPLRSQPRPYVVLCCAIVLFGWLDVAHGADIYRWKDANDVTTFSQLPPDHAVYVERLRRHDREESSTSGTMPNTASTLGNLAGLDKRSFHRVGAYCGRAISFALNRVFRRARLHVQSPRVGGTARTQCTTRSLRNACYVGKRLSAYAAGRARINVEHRVVAER